MTEGPKSKDSSPHPLRIVTAPAPPPGAKSIKVVDLFSGCGGLTLGSTQAALESGQTVDVRLAMDFEESATAVYKANFPLADRVLTSPVESVFDGEIGADLTQVELAWRAKVGPIDVLLGGPPCQGHSSLNNHTRGKDPKNALYLLMVRAAEVLSPKIVLIENVPAVRRDQYNNRNVVEQARNSLLELGYFVEERVLAVNQLGVAQLRKRHILLATKGGLPVPALIFNDLESRGEMRDLAWAIGDLEHRSGLGWDTHPKASSQNTLRMQYLLEQGLYDLPNALRPPCHQGNHSYKSMYGRLRWDRPAQTITSGFGSIGQGRYMHPTQLRALTAHEAARIQGFPDYFDFSTVSSRSALSVMIGNAVPPQLSKSVLQSLFEILGHGQQAA